MKAELKVGAVLLVCTLVATGSYRAGQAVIRNEWLSAQQKQLQAVDLARKRADAADLKLIEAERQNRARYQRLNQELIDYVSTPHAVCVHNDERMRLKRAAIAAANATLGLDDTALQDDAAKR